MGDMLHLYSKLEYLAWSGHGAITVTAPIFSGKS